MATLQIRKKSLKTWLHIPSDADNFILSKFYCKTDANTFKIVEESGSNRREYSYTDITVYDDTDIGTPETFASAQALMLRLEALKYTGFNRDGDIPTSYIESVVAGTNVTIDNTDPLNPIISSTGGGGTQDLQSVTNYGNSTTNSLNVQYGDEYTNVYTSNVYTANDTNNSYVFIENTGTIGVNSGDFEGTIKATNLVTNNVNLEFPQKTAGSYTIATTSDLSGFGDMLKSVYDTDDDGIVDSAKKEIVQFINKSGSTITKGTIVYLKSTSSSTSYPEVLKANAATEATSSKTIGAVFEDVANDATGFIVTSGEVRNLDTSAYVIGDKLWLSTTDGLVTTTVPTQPNHAVFIGTVTRAQSVNGRILYAIQNGYELGELHNVLLTTPANNEVLTYESSTSLWKNKVINQGTPLTREEFSYTSSQNFTLANTPSAIYAVFVNGQELNQSQYSNVTTTLTIVDTLESGDKVNILYTPTVAGILDYYTKAEIDAFDYESNHAEFIEVNDLTDLPSAVSGVITLTGGYTYLFLKHIDLLGSRLVCGQDTVIVGWSSENCSISSTGLSASTALVTSVYSLPIRNISFTHDLVFDLQGDGTTTALDWFGVNLLNCASGGTIKNYTNFVAGDSALLNSGGFIFDGTIGTIAFSNCLFDTASTKTAITVLSTCTVSRRLRIIYSSFVTLSGETGVNFNSSATVSDERYILDTVNFSGGGTYISGLDHTSNKSLFSNCVGITNTSTRGFMYMVNNGTDTTIGLPNVNVWVKAAGTTTAGTNNSKFTHTSNRLTYNGAFSNSFLINVNASVRSGSTSQVISIGIAKNGTIIAESEMTIRTDIANQEYPGSTLAQVEMVATDYVELFVKNTSSSNMRVSDFNISVTKIPV